MDVTVKLDNYPTQWSIGEGGQIIDVEVTLGQNEDSSSCTVTLADSDNAIASAMIDHTLKTGGIPALPKPVLQVGANGATPATNATGSGIAASSGGGLPLARGTGFTPQVLAFMNLIASHEVPNSDAPNSYYAQNEGGADWAESSFGSDGFPTDRKTGSNIGRYQFNPGDWHDFQRSDPTATKYNPVTQDKMCLWKMGVRGVLAPLNAGDIAGAIRAGGHEWASLPESVLHQTASGYTMQNGIDLYNKYLTGFHQATPDVPVVAKQDVPVTTATANKQAATKPTAAKPATTTTTPVLPIDPNAGVIKGSKLTVTLGEYQFVYYHQGTETDQDGKTKVSGQGIRWVMSRRQRNKALKGLSLKQLAQSIATAHKAQLNWQADFDVQYEHIDQSGLSDYQLLLREAKSAGLLVSEENLVLTVKTLRQMTDSGLVLTVGVNLISYQISDKAMDASKEKSIDSLLQGENKVDLDPLTGTFKISKPDVDPVKDISVSGKASSDVSGKKAPGQDALAQQNRARMKRVKGLPSTFVIPLSDDSIKLVPLAALRTKGISSVLDRVWMVDTVTHKVADGKTELKCFSPVEVIDNTPQLTTGTGTAPVVTSSTGWLVPCDGIITSPFGMRTSPTTGASSMHKGSDIANDAGTPVYASKEGVVVSSAVDGGYGNLLVIKHPDGWYTAYAHLNDFVVRAGQTVTKLQLVAHMGSTGISTGSHCHFEIRDPNGKQVPHASVGLISLSQKGTTVKAGQST